MNPLFVLLLSYFGLSCNCFLYLSVVIRSNKVVKRLYSRNKTQGQDEQTYDFFETNTITTSTILNIERRVESLVEKSAESLVENSEQFKSIMKKCEQMAEEKVNQQYMNSDTLHINDEYRILSEEEKIENENLRKWKIRKDDSSGGEDSFSTQHKESNNIIEATSSLIGETNQKDENDMISCIKTIIDDFASFLGSLLSAETKNEVKHTRKEVVTLDVVDDWLGYIDAELSEVKRDSKFDTKELVVSGIVPIDRQPIERKRVSLDNALDYMRNALKRLGIQQNKYKQ